MRGCRESRVDGKVEKKREEKRRRREGVKPKMMKVVVGGEKLGRCTIGRWEGNTRQEEIRN